MSTRYIAVKAVSRILATSGKPKAVLEDMAGNLDDRDRAFVMEIVYGVLRYRDYLDWILGKFLSKPSALSESTVNNLRIAVYQLNFMSVPEWAAVNEAVRVEKRSGGKSGLVNAVLRNYLRIGGAVGRPDEKDDIKYISVMTSHPEWLVRRWISRLGREEAFKLAAKNNEIPQLTLRIDGDIEDALFRLDDAGIVAERTKSSPSGITIRGRKIQSTEGETEARLSRVLPREIPLDASSYIIQDEAAQLMSYLLDPASGERVLDACAAPGGKTTHIARLMKDEGEVVAVEIDPRRIARIRENVSRLGLRSVKIVQGDLMNDAVEGVFDRILLDAPCSSIGVIRKNPDVKYRHQEADLERFRSTQLRLLNRAADYLKPGGTMVYSVCSTEPEEGEEVLSSFLQSKPDFCIIEGACEFLERFSYLDGLVRRFYRTWPHRDDMDGFFAARLRRVG